MDNEEYVLSWYINPHLLWLRKMVLPPDFNRFQMIFDQHYKEMYQEKYHKVYIPTLHEMVAYFNRHENKWYRAIFDFEYNLVRQLDNDDTYLLWLCDYGYVVSAHKTSVKKLEAQFMEPKSFNTVLKVGLINVLPSCESYDYIADCKQIEVLDSWRDSTVSQIETILEEAEFIYFTQKAALDDHLFGDIYVVASSGRTRSLREMMVKANDVIEMPDKRLFLKDLQSLHTIDIERYKDNRGQCVSSSTKRREQTQPSSATQKPAILNNHKRQISKEINASVERKVQDWHTANAVEIDLNIKQQNRRKEIEQSDEDDMPSLVPSNSYLSSEPKRLNKIEGLLMPEVTKGFVITDTNQSIPRPPHKHNTGLNAERFDYAKPVNVPEKSPNALSKTEKMQRQLMQKLEEKKSEKKFGEIQNKIDMDLQEKIANISKKRPMHMLPNAILPGCYDQHHNQELRPILKKTSENKTKNSPSGDETSSLSDAESVPRTRFEKLLCHSQALKSSNSSTTSDDSEKLKYKPLNDLTKINELVEDPVKFSMEKQKFERRLAEDDCGKQFIESPLVLVHGKYPADVVLSYKDAQFTESVNKGMRRITTRNEIRRLQQHVWPHLMRERSAVMIGASESGKTQAIVPAICSIITRLYEDNMLPNISGPCAIIISPFADRVSEIERLIRIYLSDYNQNATEDQRITVVASYGRYQEDRIETQLLNGLGILITTPPSLARWMAKSEEKPLLKKARVKLLAVDDFDLCRDRYGQLVLDQIDHFYVIHEDGNPTQIIITSNRWDSKLIRYCHYGTNPALFIANYIETAIYGGTKFRLCFAEKTKKLYYVQKFVENDIYMGKKSVIICSTDEEVEEVVEHLRGLLINYIKYTHKSSIQEENRAKAWHAESPEKFFSVLVCSDIVLGDLKSLRNVERLLNYSLPNSWSLLSYRFSVFFNYYHDFLKCKEAPENYKPPFAQILVDQTNLKTLPRLVTFMERINADIPDQIRTISKKILAEHEAERKSIDLCPYFLDFGVEVGKCPIGNCRRRHAFIESDRPTSRMPPCGTSVKVKLTHVHGPIHYSGQILATRKQHASEWSPLNNKDQEIEDAQLKLQMNLHFSKISNQMAHYPVAKGDICAWSEDGQVFYRVKILDSHKLKSSDVEMVTMRFIDTGEIMYDKSSSNLLALPDCLKNIPARAVDFHYLGIVPYDNDMYWGRQVKKFVKDRMQMYEKRAAEVKQKYPEREFYLKAFIKFGVENHLWISSLSHVEKVANDLDVEEKLHKALKNEKLVDVVSVDERLSALKSLTEHLGFFPEIEDEKICPHETNLNETIASNSELPNTKPDVKPSARSTWDYLESDKLNSIYVRWMKQPSEIYVTRFERLEKLAELNDKIDEYTQSEDIPKAFENPEAGENCLLWYDDGYTRARILKPNHEKHGLWDVFPCDIGDIDTVSAEEIVPTTKEIVEFMPYTSILVCLAGITPVEGETFTEETVKKMYELIDEAQKSNNLYAYVLKSNDSLDWLQPLYFYDVVFVAIDESEEFVNLNKKFVETGLAKWDLNKKEDVEKITADVLKGLHSDSEDWDSLVGTGEKYDLTKEAVPALANDESTQDLDEIIKQMFNNEDISDAELEGFGSSILKYNGLEDMIPEFLAYRRNLKNHKPEEAVIQEIPVEKSNAIKNSEPKSQLINQPKYEEDNDPLIFTFKQPQITWQQTDLTVLLSIFIGDDQDYHLEVFTDHMIFAHFPIEQEPRVSVIYFFGGIDVNLTSHQVKGLNVIIRLPKKFPGINWPRLTDEDEKYSHIKYNLDALKPIDDNFLPKMSKKQNIRSNLSDEDDDESLTDEGDEEYNELEEGDPLYDGKIKG